MEEFAALVDALVYTTSRNAKLALIADYLRRTPDPDRGWALAALTEGLSFPAVKANTIRIAVGGQANLDVACYQLHRSQERQETHLQAP